MIRLPAKSKLVGIGQWICRSRRLAVVWDDAGDFDGPDTGAGGEVCYAETWSVEGDGGVNKEAETFG
jgi:hypothetical protein